MKKAILLFFSVTLLATSCKKKTDEPTPEDPAAPVDQYASQKQQVKETYANMAFASYEDSYQGALALKTAIYTFVATPTQVNFDAAKQAWLAVREVYGQTEVFRFAEGPIDNAADGPEGLINAWPMDEVYVDYVQGDPNSGIINNIAGYPTIDQATLITANENGGEANISLGFHAIEFLLWGQDLSTTGAGARPYTDYLTVGGTASNQARRGDYLKVAADVLVAGLLQVRNAWDPAINGNYYAEFLAMDNTVALRKMFSSMKALSGDELSGERMFTAYSTQNQEDEHSCFSDNTHRDLINNAKAISNLYNGTYTKTNLTLVSGYALKDLVPLYSAAKNTDVVNALILSDTKVNAIYNPFDQAIVIPAERIKVLDAVNALQDEATKITDAAAALGITL